MFLFREISAKNKEKPFSPSREEKSGYFMALLKGCFKSKPNGEKCLCMPVGVA